MATIDELTVEVQTKAKDADNGIDTLAKGLEKLANVVEKVQSGKLKSIGRGIEQLSNGMKGLKDVKLPNYTRLSNGLSELAKVDSEKLKTVSDALNPLANSIQTLSGANFDGKNIQGFVNSITRLSNANTESLKNIDFTMLGNSIKSFAGTLAGAEKVQQNTISMTNAIAKLANAGDKADVVKNTLPSLGTALKDFMNTMSSAPKVATETIQFTQAIGTLANAGKKAETTAGNLEKLGQETLKLIQALSSAPKVSSNTISLVQAISQLANAGGRAGISSNNLSGNLGKLSKSMERTRASTNGLNGNLSSVSKNMSGIKGSTLKAVTSLKSFTTQIAASMGVYLGIYGAIRGIKKSIDISSDLVEVQNVVDTTFGDMNEKVEEFAETSIKSFGMSELSTKQFASRFQAMGKAMGISPSLIGNANSFLSEQTKGYVGMSDSMSDVSLNLTKLTADMASFYNVEQSAVAEDLAAIFTGQTRPLREYGLDLTQATLQEWALKHGMDADIKSMSQAEKTMLRYQYVLANTTASHGDFSRTVGTWANQTRILKQQFEQLGAVIGGIFTNALKPLVAGMNAALGAIINFAKNVSAILAKIFGWQLDISPKGMVNDFGDAFSEIEDAGDGAGEIASGLGDATGSAKKLQKTLSLLPFDQLNQLTGNKDTGDSGTGGVQEDGGGVGDILGDRDYGGFIEQEGSFSKMGEAIERIILRLRELSDLFKKGFFEGLGDYKPRFKELQNDILSIKESLKGIFTDPEVMLSINNFANQLSYSLGKITGSVANVGLTIAQNLVGGMESYLSQNSERVKQYIINTFDVYSEIVRITGNLSVAIADIFSVFGGYTAQRISGNLIGIFAEVKMMTSENALKLGRDMLNMIAQPIIENKDKIKGAIEGTLQAIEPVTSGILNAVQTVRDAVTDVYDNHLKPLFDSISSGFSEIFGKLLDGYNTYILPVLQGLGDKFQEIMNGPFGETVDKISELIGKMMDTARSFWESTLVPLFAWLAENVTPVLASIAAYMGGNLLNVFKTIVNIIGDTAKVFSGLIDFLTGVFAGDWEKAWGGIEQIFGGTWQAIKDILNGVWQVIKNTIKTGLQFVSNLINAVWNAIKSITTTAWNTVKTVISGAWEGIKTVVSGAINSVKSTISNAFDAIRTITTNVWNGIGGVVSKVWNGMKSSASNIFRGIGDVIKNTWENVKSTTSSVWQGIVSVIKSPVNSIIGIMNGLLSGMASAVNGIANMLNSLSFDIPDWLGGGSFHLNIPTWRPGRIPYLYNGGVLEKGQVGILEGDGAEAVVPLERNRKWINRVSEEMMKSNHEYSGGIDEDMLSNAIAQGFAMAMMANRGNQPPIHVDCYAELKTENNEALARAVAKGQQSIDYRMNPTPQPAY